MLIKISRVAACGALIIPFVLSPSAGFGQSSTTLDSLVARALAVNPAVHAAKTDVVAANAGVGPSGAWPDPMLMAGIQNLPLSRDKAGHGVSGPDPMTMKMAGVEQTIPYPGKLSLRTRVARGQAKAAEARAEVASRAVARDVREAYYD